MRKRNPIRTVCHAYGAYRRAGNAGGGAGAFHIFGHPPYDRFIKERGAEMLIRIELSTAGLNRLEAFCADRLRDGLDPRETAFALMQGAEFGGDDPVRIKLPGDLSRDGREAEPLFTDQREFIWHDLDPDPEP